MLPTIFTPESREKFLASLRTTPNVTVAARAAGISRRRAYQVREAEPEFAQAWDDAIEEGVDMLEAELHRRGYEGVDKPVTFQGKITDTFKEYSDTLAVFLMKAHRPEKYRERSNVEMTGKDGGPIEVTDQQAAAKLASILEAARQRREAGGEDLV